jgi:hypothetical protein
LALESCFPLAVFCKLSTMRLLYVVMFLLVLGSAYGQAPESKPGQNLTGTYQHRDRISVSGGEASGTFGTIKVRQLSAKKIVLSFYFNRGPKSYNSGSFLDTVTLAGRKAIYRPLDCDSNCTIIFTFSSRGVRSKHVDSDGDYNSSCCFGHAVIADGYFRKTSSALPNQMDPGLE